MSMTWRGDDFVKYIRKNCGERLEAAAIYLKTKVKENISEPSPPPSPEGTFPHKDTGRLRASISHEVDKSAQVARVGTNVIYGKFLELGSSKMAARPFLRSTLNIEGKAIADILVGKKL